MEDDSNQKNNIHDDAVLGDTVLGDKVHEDKVHENNRRYWHANIRLVLCCLAVWFTVSFGFGILWVDQLNSFRLGGFKLGFWFAQQGSIYVFLGLIIFYAHQMNKLDKKFNVKEKD